MPNKATAKNQASFNSSFFPKKIFWLISGFILALFTTSRLAVFTISQNGEKITTMTTYPGLFKLGLFFLGSLGVFAGISYLMILFLSRKGLPKSEAQNKIHEIWLPACSLLLLPLIERFTSGFGLAPLALSQEAWPLALLAVSASVFYLFYKAIPKNEKTSLAPKPWIGFIVAFMAFIAFGFMGLNIVKLNRELGPITGGDEPQYLFITQSLAIDHDLDLANQVMLRENSHFLKPGKVIGGHSNWTKRNTYMSKHMPGLPVLAAPFYAWGLKLGLGVRASCAILIWLLASWMVFEVFLLTQNLTQRQSPAFLASLSLAFTMPLLHYSNLIFPEIAAASFSLAAFRRISLAKKGDYRLILVAGIFASLLPWFNERFILPCLLLGLFFLCKGFYKKPRELAFFALPLVISGGLMMSYFYVHWGSVLPPVGMHATGVFFNPNGPWEGLTGVLFDAGEGLFVIAPIWLCAIAGLVWLIRRVPQEGIFSLLMVLATYIVAGVYTDWHGGQNPACRYLVAIIPFLAVGLGAGIRWGKARFLLLGLILLVLSLFSDWLVLNNLQQAYGSIRGHKLYFDQARQFPLLASLLPSYLTGIKSFSQNLHQGLIISLGFFALVVFLQLGKNKTTPFKAFVCLSVFFVSLSILALSAESASPGLLAKPTLAQKLNYWQKLSQTKTQGRKLPAQALEIEFPLKKYVHSPAKLKNKAKNILVVPEKVKPAPFLWGQYLNLPRGNYRVTAKVEATTKNNKPAFWIDAVSDFGKHKIQKIRKTADQLNSLVVMDFKLENPVSKFEIRMGTTGKTGLFIKSLSLVRLP